MTESRSRLLKAFRVLLAADLLTKALALASVIIVSRVVGPSALGALSLALALVSYAAVLGDGGLNTLTNRRILERPAEGAQLASTTAVAQVLVSAVLTAALAALALSGLLGDRTGQVLLALLPVLLVQALSLGYVLQSYDRMAAVAALRVTTQVIASVVGVAAVVVTKDVIWVAVASWLGALVADVVAAALLLRQGLRPQRVRLVEAMRTLRDGRALLATSVVTQWLTNIDIVVLGVLTTEFAVGQYGAAYRLVFTTLSLVAVVVTAAFPQLVRRWGQDRAGFARLLERLIRLCARTTFLAWACVIAGAPLIVDLLYGAAFAPAATPLAVLFAWVPLGFYNSLVGQGLVAAARQGTYLRVTLVTAAVVFVGLLVVVPHYGPTGAALAVAVAEVSTGVGFTLVARGMGVQGLRNLAVGLPYLVIPLGAAGTAQLVGAGAGLRLLAALTAGALVEVVLRGPTVRDLRSVKSDAASVSETTPTEGPQ